MIDRMLPRARAEAAQLWMLRADSLRLDQRYAEAGDAYRDVANRFAASSVAEAALFAEAQILVERSPQRARRTLEEYRRRYPRGRFTDEVDEMIGRTP